MSKISKAKRSKREYSDEMLWRLFFEKLLENMEALVIVSDARGKVIFSNSRNLDFLGLSRDKFEGKNWIERMIPEYDKKSVKNIFKEIKSKKVMGRFDVPVSIESDGDKFVRWIGIPLVVKRKTLYMFIGQEDKRSKKSFKKHPTGSKKYRTAYKEVVEALFAASKASDPETAEHARRVMIFAEILAKKIKISKARIERLKVASILHDLGKLAVDDKILFKQGRLTGREFNEIKKHPHWGAEVVRIVYFLHDIIPIMANHHENYDGSGYPKGLRKGRIPVEARVLSIADIYEALTADRPYRKGFSSEDAIAIIESEKGHKLDPDLTDIFLDMVRKGRFRRYES